jgi:hypothetical protein
MSWATAAFLLVVCAALGALVGMAPNRIRTGLLAFAAVLMAFLVFMPGRCASAIASTPLGSPEQLRGQTSCDTLYGAALPELGTLEADLTGRLLAMAAASVAVSGLVLVRRRKVSASPRKRDQR